MDENFYQIFFKAPEIIWIINFNIPIDSREVTAIFKNMQTLKFKGHLYKMNAFFATINHSRIKIQSESMNPETEKHTNGLRSTNHKSLKQTSVPKVIDGTKNRNCQLAFELQNSCVF